MPSSTSHGKHIVKEWFDKRSDIVTVLDVGCGQGTYPKLLGVDRYKWTGLDIFYPYKERFNLESIYKSVRIADCSIVSMEFYNLFDCVIFGDVLEHIRLIEGIRLLHQVLALGKHLVLSIPLSDSEPYEGAEHFGNPFEKHISYWTFGDVASFYPWEVAEVEKQIGVFIK
jgi:SAM-dependent methyltransferase